MRSNKGLTISLIILLILFIFIIYFWAWPFGYKIYSDMKTYETRVAYRDDYTLHTTPLSQSVINNICLKLEIKAQSENCKPGEVVYAPEFFNQLKKYFNNLPDEDKTYTTVQEKLGSYLIKCAQPDNDGDFRCKYDLQGDGAYPIFFYFNKNGIYWRIIANTGGS